MQIVVAPCLHSCCVGCVNNRDKSTNACLHFVQIPLRHSTPCWVLHPGFNNDVVGEAKAGVNNKSRSQRTDLVSACKDGQQYILFKKIHRHDAPLLFPDDAHIGPIKMCDAVLWAPGKAEKWVRWPCRYLVAKLDTCHMMPVQRSSPVDTLCHISPGHG